MKLLMSMLGLVFVFWSSLFDLTVAQNVCTLCLDGSLPGNPFAVVDDQGTRCTDVTEFALSLSADSDDCSSLRFGLGAVCKCPVPLNGCSVCPTGAAVGNPDTVLDPDDGSTCQDVDELLAYVAADSNLCLQSQSSIIGAVCGCPGNETSGGDVCTICPEGEPPANADLVINQEDNSTCADADAFAQSSGALFADLCDDTRLSISSACGCIPRSDGGCSICADGGELSNPDFAPDPSSPEITCAVIQEQLRFVSSDDQICTDSQALGTFCGCSNANQNATGLCSLCPDGSTITNPDFVIDNDGSTCAQVEGFVLPNFPLGSDICDATVFQFSAVCGCPSAEPGPDSCEFCPGGADPLRPDAELNPEDEFSLTCQFYADNIGLASSTGTLCELASNLTSFCGCPGVENTCPLCEDGSDIPEPDRVVAGDTCLDLSFLISTLPEGQCAQGQATAGVYCGCDNPIASEGFCRICGDGVLLPDANIMVALAPGEEISCGELEFSTLGFECSVLQSTFASQCCPTTVAPAATTMPPTTMPPTAMPVSSMTPAPVGTTPASVAPSSTETDTTNATATPTAAPSLVVTTPAPTTSDSNHLMWQLSTATAVVVFMAV